MPGAPSHIVPVIFILIVVWRLFIRFRRNVGRQPLRPRRMIFRIVVYGLVTFILGAVAVLVAGRISVLAGLVGGLALGAGLGVYGLQLTKFERTPAGYFYTPNPYMGVGLSMLLAARLFYRAAILSSASAQPNAPQLMQSPLTMFLYGLLAGDYIAYFIGVLVRSNETSIPAS